VAPPVAKIEDDIKAHLNECGLKYKETEDFQAVAKIADVIYMTRYQLERSEGEEKRQLQAASKTHVMNRKVATSMPKNSIILHPLPRIKEIGKSVDANRRAKYFAQAANGKYVRMALLLSILKPQVAIRIMRNESVYLNLQF